MAFCKSCRTNATTESALTAKRCIHCGCTDYILPGLNSIGLMTYYINRGRWDEAKAALLAAGLDAHELNHQHSVLLDQRECAAWVERNELMALPKQLLHAEVCERYDAHIADWYCDEYLGGYDQRWQTSASVKANGLTD